MNKNLQRLEEIKQKYPKAIVLFRTGDNYQSFNSDADVISKVTGSDIEKNESEGYRYTFFQSSKLDMYLPILVRRGYRIAICDSELP
jgi:DNA mismatch repair protein MutS